MRQASLKIQCSVKIKTEMNLLRTIRTIRNVCKRIPMLDVLNYDNVYLLQGLPEAMLNLEYTSLANVEIKCVKKFCFKIGVPDKIKK